MQRNGAIPFSRFAAKRGYLFSFVRLGVYAPRTCVFVRPVFAFVRRPVFHSSIFVPSLATTHRQRRIPRRTCNLLSVGVSGGII